MDESQTPMVGDDARGNPEPQWEVFVREDASAPLAHVGSVGATSPEAAQTYAKRLFPEAVDRWCCRADDVSRFSTRSLRGAIDEDRADERDEGRVDERDEDCHGNDAGGQRQAEGRS